MTALPEGFIAMPKGFPPAGIVPMLTLVAVLMTETVLEPQLAT